MKNLIALGLLVAFVGVCQCQFFGGPQRPPLPQQFRPSVDSRFDADREEPDRYESERRRYGSDGDRYGGYDGYNKRERYDRRSNCEKSGPEGFDTGYCKQIPDDRDLEQSHDEEALAADITEFALQLFKASNKPEVENIVLSGLSPQVLLSYLNWASDGVTRDEMKKAKVFGTPKNVQKLISRILSSNDENREMNIATAFFSSPDVVLNKDFKVKASEKVDIVNVDFKKSSKASNSIRNWATQKTKGKLDLSGISFPIDTKLALVSTMLYSGKWYFKFENVTNEDFTLASGKKIKVPMMKIKKKYNHGLLGEYAEWGSIPYRSKEAMVIIMPKNGDTIDDTIKKLTNEEVLDICDSARSDYTSAELTLSLPKFKLATTTNLVEPLKKMGIQKLFTPAAELAYLAKDRNIQVSDVEQKSGIEVDEDGTIVVTYTNVNAVALSIQRDPPKVTFTVDRPFIAMICDVQRSLPLVMAKISDPSKSE